MSDGIVAFILRYWKRLREGEAMRAGFTLLELIISIAILSAVLVTIYATLSMGSRTWDKGERDIEKVQRMRVVMDLLSREIKAAYPYKVTPGELDTHREFYLFDGQKDSLSFVSCVPLRGGTGKLSWLTFWVEEGMGLVVVERDALRSDIFKERETMDTDEMVVLDANATAIRFDYYRSEEGDTEEATDGEDTAWEEKWDAEEEESMPQAVSVAVTFREDAEGQGGENESYTRELVIPLMIGIAEKSGGRQQAAPESLMGGDMGMTPEGGETGGSFAQPESGRVSDRKKSGDIDTKRWGGRGSGRNSRTTRNQSK
jgi:prepilin-type N-terminal cleavage/methylation domain-containing protein